MCKLGLALWQPVTLPCPRGHRAHTSCEQRAFGVFNPQGCVASLAFAGIFINEADGLLPSESTCLFPLPHNPLSRLHFGGRPSQGSPWLSSPFCVSVTGEVQAYGLPGSSVACVWALTLPLVIPLTAELVKAVHEGQGIWPLGVRGQDSGCRSTPKTPPLPVTAKVVGMKQC